MRAEDDTATQRSATHLIASNHADDGDLDDYAESRGTCCFCGDERVGIGVDDAVSHKYFSDYPLMWADTGHVCQFCAYCMNNRGLKQGHWIATPTEHRSVSTGDLLDTFDSIREGQLDTPIAVHVSENPIRSEHAYIWTPVSEGAEPLQLSYARETLELRWSTFDDVFEAIEELRWHGFRGDDIRSGEPRVDDLASVGRDRYRELEAAIKPHRGTPLLEVAWTLSRAQDDQPNPPESA